MHMAIAVRRNDIDTLIKTSNKLSRWLVGIHVRKVLYYMYSEYNDYTRQIQYF